MSIAMMPTIPSVAPQTGSALARLIGAIGCVEFERQLFEVLNKICGADHCAMYWSSRDKLHSLYAQSLDGTDTALRQVRRYVDEQHWRRDPMIAEALASTAGQPILLRFNTRKFSDPYLRDLIYGRTHVMERMIVCRPRRDFGIGFNILSVLRCEWRGPFGEDEVSRLGALAEVLISIIEKHEDIATRRPSVSKAMESIAEIERCIARAPERPPRRELEVCARILIGQSLAATATELGIGEQSVATYRKRAYQRLGIGSRRDLILWYLALWQRETDKSRADPAITFGDTRSPYRRCPYSGDIHDPVPAASLHSAKE